MGFVNMIHETVTDRYYIYITPKFLGVDSE